MRKVKAIKLNGFAWESENHSVEETSLLILTLLMFNPLLQLTTRGMALHLTAILKLSNVLIFMMKYNGNNIQRNNEPTTPDSH